jgi:ABC-type polysaccharide/polyol phosphate export permease
VKNAQSSLRRGISKPGLTKTGALELLDGCRNWRVAYLMGLGEIRRRYARSMLGQFWVTLTTAVMTLGLGFVWAGLWKEPVADLMPFFAISYTSWLLISGTLVEATTVLTSSAALFNNQGMSFATAIYGLVFRHLFILAHNLPIVVGVFVFFQVPLKPVMLMVVPGLVLVCLILTWSGYVIAIACARFRDLTHVVQSIVTMAFFVTPILWQANQIPADRQYLLLINPFAVMLSVVRDPLLGTMPPWWDWAIGIAMVVFGFAFALPFVGYCRRRLIYWI